MRENMDTKLRMCLAELIGTFFLVLIGAGTVCASALTSPPLSVTAPALAEGFTYAAVLTATFYISTGCLNPAITIMLWVFKRLDNARAGWLILMQLLGAVLAGLVLRVMFRTDVLAETHTGAPFLKAFNPQGGPLEMRQLVSGMAFELFLTCLVTLAAFATLFDRRAPRLGGLIVGLAQTAVVLFGYRFTGGAANPARWFGPALWQATLSAARTNWLAEAVVYAGGPILGALLAAMLYVNLILPPEKGTESLR
jgi:glycerol uptake facilitator-like aquaporin